MNRQDLKSTLETMGHEQATPDVEFVNRLELRIEHLPVRPLADVRQKRRIVVPQIPWVMGAIFTLLTSVVGVQQFVLSSDNHAANDSTTTTTSTTVAATSTTVSKPPTFAPLIAPTPVEPAPSAIAPSTTIRVGTSPTSEVAYETTTTIAKTSGATSTTTTTIPPTETMSITCGTGVPSGVPTTSCNWTASTSQPFTRYDLQRINAGGGTWTVIHSTTNRSATNFADTTVVQGQSYSYVVIAYGENGSVIGYSKHYSTTCCQT
jgi:hypothetical protein